jgi:transposase
MPTDAKPIQRLISLFAEQPCWMIAPLASELQYSIPSVRRFLSEAGYSSSFTHNGGWYTLCSTPQFDGDGLWFYHDIGFSRAGTLTKTLIALVTHSPAGMTAEELGDKLHCRCHSILVHLCRKKGLQRQKQGRSYRYLAADAHTAASQRQAMAGLPGEQLPAEIAVFVLAEFIRNPRFSFQQLAAALARNKGVTVEVTQLERLFAQHGLKKTMRTQAPRPYPP